MVVDNLIRQEARQRAQLQQQQQSPHLNHHPNSRHTVPSPSFVSPSYEDRRRGFGGGGMRSEDSMDRWQNSPMVNAHGNHGGEGISYHYPNARDTITPRRVASQDPSVHSPAPLQPYSSTMDSRNTAVSSRSSFSQEAPHPPHSYHHSNPQQQPIYIAPTTNPWYEASSPEHHQQQQRPTVQQQQPQHQTHAVSLARQEWRQHGVGMTQALEELRQEQQQHGLMVRVIAAQPRVDVSQKEYTAYVLRVTPLQQQQQQSNEWTVEHRYSEFHKLHAVLQRHGVRVPTPFPGRSLSGRLGLWSPAQVWAPQSYHKLIQYRLKQLDIWLVHVVHLVYSQSMPRAVQTAVQDFCTQKSPLPCHQDWQEGSSETVQSTSLHNETPFLVNEQDSQQLLLSKPESSSSATSLNWWKRHNPVSFSLTSAIRQACWTVDTMCPPLPSKTTMASSSLSESASFQESDQSIPVDLLHAAQGILFLTVAKAGLVVSGRVGTGLLVKRLSTDAGDDDNLAGIWSAPIAVGTMGMGWGALVGGDVTHYMVVFTTEQAVLDLVHQKNSLQVGAELDVAVGPLGRGAHSQLHTGDWTLHTAYAYAHSQGLFAGLSLEGSFLTIRKEVNAQFYGGALSSLSALELLSQTGPKAAQPLYQALEKAMRRQVHEYAFRPSRIFMPSSAPKAPSTIHYNSDIEDSVLVPRPNELNSTPTLASLLEAEAEEIHAVSNDMDLDIHGEEEEECFFSNNLTSPGDD